MLDERSRLYIGRRTRPTGDAGVTVGDHKEGASRRQLPLRLDLDNHSPDGFEWGYGGSGPAQLGLAILADHFARYPEDVALAGPLDRVVGPKDAGALAALRLHQDFKFAIIATIPRGVDAWSLESDDVRDYLVERAKQRETPGHVPTWPRVYYGVVPPGHPIPMRPRPSQGAARGALATFGCELRRAAGGPSLAQGAIPSPVWAFVEENGKQTFATFASVDAFEAVRAVLGERELVQAFDAFEDVAGLEWCREVFGAWPEIVDGRYRLVSPDEGLDVAAGMRRVLSYLQSQIEHAQRTIERIEGDGNPAIAYRAREAREDAAAFARALRYLGGHAAAAPTSSHNLTVLPGDAAPAVEGGAHA